MTTTVNTWQRSPAPKHEGQRRAAVFVGKQSVVLSACQVHVCSRTPQLGMCADEYIEKMLIATC